MRYAAVSVAMLCIHTAVRAQAPAEWKLLPLARVGGSDAHDERYTFDLVPAHGLAGRANGHVLLLDVAGKRLLEYDAGGRHVRTTGRGGEGPGEFRFPFALTDGPGDSAWVSDVGRYTVFPPAAGVLRTTPTPTRTFGQFRVGPQGIVHALSAVPGTASGVSSLTPDRIRLARFNPRGELEATVWTGPYPRRVPVSVQVGQSSYSTHAVEQYGMTTHWDMLRDGTLVVSDTSAYLLRLVSSSGRILKTIGPGEAPRRLTPADRERALARIRDDQRKRQEHERNERFRNPAVLWLKQLEATPFAEVVPRVSGVRVDPTERIWVGVSGDRADLERIDVYDRDGNLLARVLHPPAMPVVLYGDGLAAFMERDDLDAQTLRIMRVVER